MDENQGLWQLFAGFEIEIPRQTDLQLHRDPGVDNAVRNINNNPEKLAEMRALHE